MIKLKLRNPKNARTTYLVCTDPRDAEKRTASAKAAGYEVKVLNVPVIR